MRCSRRAWVALLACLWLAACGDVPRPFQPDYKPLANPLLQRPERAGVIVMPLSGAADDAQSLDFSDVLSAALRSVDVMAHNGAGNRNSLVLSSYLERGPGDDGVLILWLSNGAGTDIGTYEVRVRPRDLLGDTPARRVAMRGLAERVAAELDPERARLRDAPPLFVQRVEGLPPAQAAPLERALVFWLRRSQMEIADRPTAEFLSLAGGVAFRDRPRNMVALEVVWRLIASDGTEIGRITQQNDVPVALLTDGWADVAASIAEGAMEGIVELVERARGRSSP